MVRRPGKPWSLGTEDAEIVLWDGLGTSGPGLDQIPGAGEAYRELAIELAPVAKAVLRRHPGPV
jgi:hypothetical protein